MSQVDNRGGAASEALPFTRVHPSGIPQPSIEMRSHRIARVPPPLALSLAVVNLVLVRSRFRCPMKKDSYPQKLLFVCSQNKLRSLTAEKLFEGFPAYQVRSAGTQPEARLVLTEGHIGWADVIFVMEKSHLNRIRRKFPQALQSKRVITLGIPDDYEFMQPELLDELRGKLGPYVMLPAEIRNA